MELWRLSFQILFFELICTIYTGALVLVHQSGTLSATVGGSAHLACTFRKKEDHPVRVTWARGMGQLLWLNLTHTPDQKYYLSPVSRRGEWNEVTLTISQLTEEDSDHYYCHVKVHEGESGTGGGTKLEVSRGSHRATTMSTPTTKDAAPGIIIQSALNGLLVFGGILGCCLSSYMPLKLEEDAVGGSYIE